MSIPKTRLSFALLLTMPALARASEGGMTLAEVSQTLLVGGDALAKLMWAACIVVGIALIAAAFTQFQIHRRNPKLVPLTTPVMYLILGVVSISIPFIDTMKGFMGGEGKKVSGAPAQSPNRNPNKPVYNPNDIDAPLN